MRISSIHDASIVNIKTMFIRIRKSIDFEGDSKYVFDGEVDLDIYYHQKEFTCITKIKRK